jgi:hypothetical protein
MGWILNYIKINEQMFFLRENKTDLFHKILEATNSWIIVNVVNVCRSDEFKLYYIIYTTTTTPQSSDIQVFQNIVFYKNGFKIIRIRLISLSNK